MQSNVLIFHGTGGHPLENWFPWLKEKLEKKNYKVIVPQFPTPNKPLLQPWLTELKKYEKYIDKNTILIGHSLGGLFLLRILERLEKPVKAAIFVAPSVGIKPIKFYQGDFDFSNGFSFDWKKTNANAEKFIVFHSDNDPYISIENGKEVAKNLDIQLTFVPNSGHFNTVAGYTKFELLLDKVFEIK